MKINTFINSPCYNEITTFLTVPTLTSVHGPNQTPTVFSINLLSHMTPSLAQSPYRTSHGFKHTTQCHIQTTRVTSIYTSKMSVSLSLTTTNSYMYILTCTLSDMHFLFFRNNSVTSNKICLLKGVSPRDPITCYNLFQQSSYINNYKLIPGAVLGRYMIHGADVGGI